MASDHLKILRENFRELKTILDDVKFDLAARRFANELKFDPNQPRAPEGTSTGGQWTGTGRSTSPARTRTRASPPSAPHRQQTRKPPNLASLPRAASRASLPLIAGTIGIQRAAGTFASVVSGQEKTPILHIPYSLPTRGTLPAPRGGRLMRSRTHPAPRLRPEHFDSVDRQCDINLSNDVKTCSRNAARYGRENGDERVIFAICHRTAMERYSECKKGGGIHAIRTPLYRGHNHRGG